MGNATTGRAETAGQADKQDSKPDKPKPEAKPGKDWVKKAGGAGGWRWVEIDAPQSQTVGAPQEPTVGRPAEPRSVSGGRKASKQETEKQVKRLADTAVAGLQAIGMGIAGEEAAMTSMEKLLIVEPLQNTLERLDVAVLDKIAENMDPLILFGGLLAYGFRVRNLAIEQRGDDDSQDWDDEEPVPDPQPGPGAAAGQNGGQVRAVPSQPEVIAASMTSEV